MDLHVVEKFATNTPDRLAVAVAFAPFGGIRNRKEKKLPRHQIYYTNCRWTKVLKFLLLLFLEFVS